MKKIVCRIVLFCMLLPMAACNAKAVSVIADESNVQETSNANIQVLGNGEYPAPIQDSSQLGNQQGYPYPLQNLSTLPAGQLPDSPADAPQPQPEKASLSGIVFSISGSVEIPNALFFLVLASGDDERPISALDGPDPDQGDILGTTDSEGLVRINNIPPGNYYLVVWTPAGWTPVVDTSTDAYTPILFTFEADKAYPLGVLQVSWP